MTGELERFDFIALLGQGKIGRLVFTSGASRVMLVAEPELPELVRARFIGQVPQVWVCARVVTIRYPYFPLPEMSHQRGEQSAHIRLNASLPWEVEFHGGVSHLTAQLGGLQLRSLDILGGASHIRLVLSKPVGTTYIYVSGGINDGAILRPAGVALRLKVGRGISRLAFDDQSFGALGAEKGLESPGFTSTSGRYDIYIAGGANNLRIDRAR